MAASSASNESRAVFFLILLFYATCGRSVGTVESCLAGRVTPCHALVKHGVGIVCAGVVQRASADALESTLARVNVAHKREPVHLAGFRLVTESDTLVVVLVPRIRLVVFLLKKSCFRRWTR